MYLVREDRLFMLILIIVSIGLSSVGFAICKDLPSVFVAIFFLPLSEGYIESGVKPVSYSGALLCPGYDRVEDMS